MGHLLFTRNFRIHLIILFQLSVLTVAGQTTIYVSAKGNDAQNGTANAPLATIQAAIDKSALLRKKRKPADTIFIKILAGEYFINRPLCMGKDYAGTNLSSIVIKGEGVNKSVVYGGIKLNRFEKVNNSLWKVLVPQTQSGFAFEQLYVNGERRFRAQTPNRNDFLSIKSVEEKILDSALTNGRFRLASLRLVFDEQSAAWLKDVKADENNIIASVYYKWNNSRLKVDRVSPDTKSAHFTEYMVQPWNRIDTKSRIYFENYSNALDAPGEWFLDKTGYLYYIPMPGEKIESVTAIAPVTEKLIVIEGNAEKRELVENIEFNNIGFRVAGYTMPLKGDPPAQAAHITDAVVMLDYVKNISFKNCEIANTGLYGVWFRRACSQSSLVQCHLHDLGGGGVKIGDYKLSNNLADTTHHITIDNNIIQHGGYIFPAAVGIAIFHSMDNQVSHNDIADFRYTGVSVGWVWGYANSYAKRNKIEYNHIHHLGWGELSDMGGIYTLGRSEGTSVSNNKVHHIYSRYYGGWGLYTDEGSSNITLENNLVYACKSAGFHQHYGKDNIIKNNIFVNQLRDQLQATKVEPHHSFSFTNNIIYFEKGELAGKKWKHVSFTSDKNCYWNPLNKEIKFQGIPFKEWQQKGKDVNSIIVDPQFANVSAFDFNICNKEVVKVIGFTPFDYTKCGVYGKKQWIQKAQIDAALIASFDKLVEKMEKENISD